MKDYRSEQIRNLVLLSHGGAGKTSLSEALLYNCGAISRLGRVDEGNTTSDFDPDETKRHISVNLSLLPCEVEGIKVNIIDTPGYADFVGEVKSGLRAADCALIIVCAVSGVEVGTEQVWHYARGLPRLIFINKMDRENADFYRTLEQIEATFGKGCVPLQLPIGAQEGFQGVVDLLSGGALIAEKGEPAEAPAEMAETIASYRERLVEAIAESDDELLTKYLEGEELSQAELRSALKSAVAAGLLTPILSGSALKNLAVMPLFQAFRDFLPSPLEMGPVRGKNPATGEPEELTPDANGPLAALVFKTTADPYVGKLTYFRVYSGTLSSNSEAYNANKGLGERLGQLFVVRGKGQENVTALVAGDIGAVAKLGDTTTGDTLCNRDHPVILPPPEFPAPLFSAAVYPKSKADVDKLGASLSRLVEEDPSLQVHRDTDTQETILSGVGESHLEVTLERMKRKFGVDVLLRTPKVPYKETITVPARAEYKHKKQTGGHGQYGHVFLELEPLPRGSGFEFGNRIVGGVVPKNYIPAVEKGVRAALQEGVVAHYPVVDVKVTLYDGSYHEVDSSDISFQIAGSMAFKKGVAQGNPTLIEPIMNLTVTVPDAYTGDTIGDLNSKRARIMGMTPQDGMSVIEAQVPLAEVLRYATQLRSITQGRGSFSMEFSHYEEVPAHIAQKVAEEASREQ